MPIKLRQLLENDVELTPDGELRINSIDSISPEQWAQISRIMVQKGYDSRGAEDAKRAVEKFIERAGEPIVKHPHWAETIAHVLGLARMKSKKKELPSDVQKKVMSAAIRKFGITTNIKLAGWILPNGKFLNFSHEGMSRDKDHSEIGFILSKYGLSFGKERAPLYATKEAFAFMGAIRINGDGPQIMIGKMPTTQQFEALDYIFHVNNGAIDLDMVHPTHGSTGKSYTEGTKPKRIYYDIVNFYKTGQGPRDTLFEGVIKEDLRDVERFREPLIKYMKSEFRKEYDDRQLLMFDLTMDDLISVFLNKILSIEISFQYSYAPYDELPHGWYNLENNTITVAGLDASRYRSVNGESYRKYIDSVIFHELVHAVNYHKKLFDKITYDPIMMGDKYYGDPEEVRAYKAEIKTFLMGHLGLSRKQAETLMNKYSSDRSEIRKRWMAKYADLQEIEYPMATGDDLASYGGMAGWKGKIVWMTPDKFLSLAYPLSHPIPQSLSRLEKRMREQLPIDFLVLKIDSKRNKVIGHEGRHRATIAKKLGIEKVPVLVYFEESYPRVPKWSQSQHDYADKAEFKPEWDPS